jgi:hypothetical protein
MLHKQDTREGGDPRRARFVDSVGLDIIGIDLYADASAQNIDID